MTQPSKVQHDTTYKDDRPQQLDQMSREGTAGYRRIPHDTVTRQQPPNPTTYVDGSTSFWASSFQTLKTPCLRSAHCCDDARSFGHVLGSRSRKTCAADRSGIRSVPRRGSGEAAGVGVRRVVAGRRGAVGRK